MVEMFMTEEEQAISVFKSRPEGFFSKRSNVLRLIVNYVSKIAELRKKNKELRTVAENQRKIISILAHDVRSPLASIKSVFELQDNELLDAEESSVLLDHIKTQLGNTMEMVDDIVNWGQMSSQPEEIQPEDIDVHQLIERIFGSSLLKSIEKNNKLINNVPERFMITSNYRAVEIILRNLISNANKFTETGTICVDIDRKDEKVILCVKDTGVGMTAEKREELLYADQLSSTLGTNKEKGNGLGFMLVKEFVNNLEGSIAIESAVNEGTCFKIAF